MGAEVDRRHRLRRVGLSPLPQRSRPIGRVWAEVERGRSTRAATRRDDHPCAQRLHARLRRSSGADANIVRAACGEDAGERRPVVFARAWGTKCRVPY